MSKKEKEIKKKECEKKNTKSSESKEHSNDICKEELYGVKAQLLRVNADFQNFKKRVDKEKTEWISVGQSMVIEKILSFVDDLDLAISATKDQLKDEKASWLEGFLLIQSKFKKVFKDLDIEEIDCSKDFNPEYHEALMQVDSKDHKTGRIVQVFQKGYLFKDKVLRHAKVSVAK